MRFPWERTRLIADTVAAVPISPETLRHELPIAIDMPVEQEELEALEHAPTDKLLKLEVLLYEKNKSIEKLTGTLNAERAHRAEFEKVKDLMAEEILRLKNQLKDLKKKVSHNL